MFALHQLVHVPIAHNLMLSVSTHKAIAVAECVEVGTEYSRVKESVLTVQIHRVVLHRRPTQGQLILRLVTQLVKRFALGCGVVLDALAFVANNQIRVVLLKGFKDPVPVCTLVVDHGNFELCEWPDLQSVQCFEALLLLAQ